MKKIAMIGSIVILAIGLIGLAGCASGKNIPRRHYFTIKKGYSFILDILKTFSITIQLYVGCINTLVFEN